MSNFFTDNKKTSARYECKYFTIYEPTQEQEDYLKGIFTNKIGLSEESEVEVGYDLISYAINELTNLGDDLKTLSKEEFADVLENGNENIQILMRELKNLFGFITKKVMWELEDNMETTLRAIELYNIALTKTNVERKMVKFFNKMGIDVGEGEVMELVQDTEKLNELLKQKPKTPIKPTKPKRKVTKKKK